MFITFEGGEGAGKSTQVRRLGDRLRSLGSSVLVTREPGGSPKAERLRALLLSGAVRPYGPAAEGTLFAAARLDHVEATIRPALLRGEIVICDRFTDSTRVYQGASGEVAPELIARLERVATGGLRPDLTLMLDLPVEVGQQRVVLRTGGVGSLDRFEGEGIGFHRMLRDGFLGIARGEPDRCVVVDATPDAATVAELIWAAVEPRLGTTSRAP